MLTRLNVTANTSCPAGTVTRVLKAAGWVAGGVPIRACTVSAAQPAAGSADAFVSDITVSAR